MVQFQILKSGGRSPLLTKTKTSRSRPVSPGTGAGLPRVCLIRIISGVPFNLMIFKLTMLLTVGLSIISVDSGSEPEECRSCCWTWESMLTIMELHDFNMATEVNIGDNVTIPCEANSWETVASITWSKLSKTADGVSKSEIMYRYNRNLSESEKWQKSDQNVPLPNYLDRVSFTQPAVWWSPSTSTTVATNESLSGQLITSLEPKPVTVFNTDQNQDQYQIGLILSNVTSQDFGAYQCCVHHLNSASLSHFTNILVVVPPSRITLVEVRDGNLHDNENELIGHYLDQDHQGMHLKLGPYQEQTELNLTCTVYGGVPRPKISWLRNGEPYHRDVTGTNNNAFATNESSEFHLDFFTISTMYIPRLKPEHYFNTFTCFVSASGSGSTSEKWKDLSASVKLAVYLKPKVVEPVVPEEMVAGKEYKLTCSTSGAYPVVTIVIQVKNSHDCREGCRFEAHDLTAGHPDNSTSFSVPYIPRLVGLDLVGAGTDLPVNETRVLCIASNSRFAHVNDTVIQKEINIQIVSKLMVNRFNLRPRGGRGGHISGSGFPAPANNGVSVSVSFEGDTNQYDETSSDSDLGLVLIICSATAVAVLVVLIIISSVLIVCVNRDRNRNRNRDNIITQENGQSTHREYKIESGYDTNPPSLTPIPSEVHNIDNLSQSLELELEPEEPEYSSVPVFHQRQEQVGEEILWVTDI